MKKNKKINFTSPTILIIIINLIMFILVNLLITPKYEQVDDFMIYNLYSGLDGSHNANGIYMNPILCFILSIFYKINPLVNWHTIFLLIILILSLTIIGKIIYTNNKTKKTLVLYIISLSIIYPMFLLMIQYTSVAALAFIASFIEFIDIIQKEKKSKKSYFVMYIMFIIGLFIREQSFLIILPIYILYIIYMFIDYKKEKININQLKKFLLIFLLLIFIMITIHYLTFAFYMQSEINKEYMKFNKIRTIFHDLSKIKYNENREVFEKNNWSLNDYCLFYTFNFGDENIFNIESLTQILKNNNLKIEFLNLNYSNILLNLKDKLFTFYLLDFFLIIVLFVYEYKNSDKYKKIKLVFLACFPIVLNILFIAINRPVYRVVMPEYVITIFLLIYFLDNKEYEEKINISKKNKIFEIICLIIISIINIQMLNEILSFDYDKNDYNQYKELIEYTNNHKENMYLYTVPSLQDRYLVYNIYEMPPEESFSNLRIMGGWDMYTENYYKCKERYNLNGNFLDVLKENVYVIDGEVKFFNMFQNDYIERIKIFIKEHYNIEVEYKKVKDFENLHIYKFVSE